MSDEARQGCPVTPQELIAADTLFSQLVCVVNNAAIADHIPVGLKERANDCLRSNTIGRTADWLEKPAPAASEPTRAAEGYYKTAIPAAGEVAPPTAQARPQVTREQVLAAFTRATYTRGQGLAHDVTDEIMRLLAGR